MSFEIFFKKPAVLAGTALFCCLLWGSAFPAIILGYEWFGIDDLGSQILFAGYRFFIAGLLTFAAGCLMERRLLRIKLSSTPAIIRQALLQTTIQYFFFYIGLAHTTGTKGSIINACAGFVSIIAAHFMIRGEGLTRNKVIGCLLGFAGIIILNLSPGAIDGGFSFMGEGMILICTIVYGISTVTMKQISHLESPMAITAYQLTIGGALLILIGLIFGGHFAIPSPAAAGLFFYMCALSTVAFSLWTLLIKYNPVSRVAIYSCAIPVFGTLLSGLILGEDILQLKNLVALLLVSSGIYVANAVTEKKKTLHHLS